MVTATALMATFGVGMCFSLLGAISVKLMPRLEIDTGKFGTLVSALMVTAVAASTLVGMGIDSFGHKPFAIIGFLIAGGSIGVIARIKSYAVVLGACLAMGVGAMCLSNVGNTLLPEVLFQGEAPAAAMNLGNVFFGLGLFITPFITSFLFQRTTYENSVSVLAAIILFPVIFAVLGTDYPGELIDFSPSEAAGLLTHPVVLIAGLAMFCYISLESSFSNWIAPYAKGIISRDFKALSTDIIDATSQRLLSVFAITMMAGRLLASQIPMIEQYGAIVVALLAAVSALIIIAMTVSTAMWTPLLVGCGGLAYAAMFPIILAMAFGRYPDNFGTVFGIIFAMGLFGAVIVPKAIGNLAKGTSVQRSMRLLLPFCLGLIVFAIVLAFIA